MKNLKMTTSLAIKFCLGLKTLTIRPIKPKPKKLTPHILKNALRYNVGDVANIETPDGVQADEVRILTVEAGVLSEVTQEELERTGHSPAGFSFDFRGLEHAQLIYWQTYYKGTAWDAGPADPFVWKYGIERVQ